uniref:Uncharacterized protein n=1 Tax=Oryza rufipogon TaxID=4529 RepID=A0A0E0QMM0_ORYRU
MMPTNVHISAALMVSLVLAATVVAHVEVGEVGEYLEKRSQEARHKNHVGPLHDLVNTATRLTAGGLCWVMKHICKRGLEASSVESGDDHQVVQDHNGIQL